MYIKRSLYFYWFIVCRFAVYNQARSHPADGGDPWCPMGICTIKIVTTVGYLKLTKSMPFFLANSCFYIFFPCIRNEWHSVYLR